MWVQRVGLVNFLLCHAHHDFRERVAFVVVRDVPHLFQQPFLFVLRIDFIC